MSEYKNVRGTVSKKTRLSPKGYLDIKFNPRAGKVTISAFVKKPGTPVITGKPSADPDDPDFDFFEVKGLPILVEILAPNGNIYKRFPVIDTTVTGSEDLKLIGSIIVPQKLAKKTWKCRFRNTQSSNVVCTGLVNYTKRKHLIHESKIPLRVLNGAAREFLKGLQLQIKLDGSNSFIDFSSALKHHSGGALERIKFDVPFIQDVNLMAFSVEAKTKGAGRNREKIIEVAGSFEQEGKEFNIKGVQGDIYNIGFKIIFTLSMSNTSSRINYSAKVETGIYIERKFVPIIKAFELGYLIYSLGKAFVIGTYNLFKGKVKFSSSPKKLNLKNLDEILIEYAEKFLNNRSNRKKIRAFLTDGITHLVQKGHTLHRLEADDHNFIVKHYNANIEEEEQKVVNTPPPIPDRLPTASEKKGVQLLKKVDHIVFLMMENRSFDHLFGYLSLPVNMGGKNLTQIDGLRGTESNKSGPTGVVGISEEKQNTTFVKSPGHDYSDVSEQMNDGKMDGFLSNFVKKFGRDEFLDIKNKVNPLAYYTNKLLPTYDFFTKNFLICDHWHASHPGPTWPNRFCTLSGKTPELDNLETSDPRVGYLTLKTIFDLLPKFDWKVFESDISFLRMYDKYRLEDDNIVPVNEFFELAKAGNLPMVSMIEPNYADFLPDDLLANDDHPPANLYRGQIFMEQIYNALRNSVKWEKTMFIITYDEHGGFFDHVPPPGTSESPNDSVPKVHPNGPTFLGPRVPGIVISPWVGKEGSAVDVNHTIFDHTSFIKTVLLKKYGAPHPKMTERVEQANNLGILLTNDVPRLDIPELKPLIKPKSIPRGVNPVDDGSIIGPKRNNRDFHEAMMKFGLPR